MKIKTLASILALITLIVAANSNAQTTGWNSFDSGLEAAKSSNKKVLIDVYTDWCGWCKKMDAEVYTDAAVKDYLGKNFVIIKLNAESDGTIHYKGREYTHPQIAAAFGINGYPTTIFLKENGDPITLLPGFLDASKFIYVLSYIAENEFEHKPFDTYLKEKGVQQ